MTHAARRWEAALLVRIADDVAQVPAGPVSHRRGRDKPAHGDGASVLVPGHEFIRGMPDLEQLEVVDVVRLHCLVPHFEPQGAIDACSHVQAVHIPRFEQRRHTVGEPLGLEYECAGAVGIHRWAGPEDRLQQGDTGHDAAAGREGRDDK